MKWLCYPALVLFALSGVFANVVKFQQDDARLEKLVTIEENYAKLEDVAKSLSEQAGVEIKVGTGTRDWKVRERKVAIHAKDLPLGQMLDEIKRLTGYHISREGEEGEWSYLIWQDLKGRRLEEEMLIASKEAQSQRAIDMRRGAIDTAENALNMSPDDALKLREENPMMAYLGGTQPGRGLAQILSSLQHIFPTEYELMLRGKNISIPVSSFPPALDGAVNDVLGGGLLSWVGDAQIVPREIEISSISGGDSGIEDMIGMGGIMSFNVGISTQENGGFPAVMLPLASSDSFFSRFFGKVLLAVEDGVNPGEASRQIGEETANTEFILDAIAKKSPMAEDPPVDPKLSREIELPKAPDLLDSWATISGDMMKIQGEYYAELAEAAEISIFVETYPLMIPFAAFLKEGKQPFYHILVAAEKAGCAWELGEGTLRIKPED